MEKYVKDISKSIVLIYSHIYKCIHTFNIYIICHKKAMYDLSENIIFSVAVSSLLKSVIETITCTNSAPAMQVMLHQVRQMYAKTL